jgi:preprotein translocase subunit SecE
MEVKSMDLKNSVQTNKTKEATEPKKRLRDVVADIKTELRNISWTSKEELQVYTKIVVGATFFFGMGIYFVDLIIQGALNTLALLTRLLLG